ncbi:MAG: PQQ-dependent sugar dehydrogenase [Thermoleophilaceae bacterium]|nr:PQQ-dependent sugar dehydrogenase [Thermoleophilaceae bacterium]
MTESRPGTGTTATDTRSGGAVPAQRGVRLVRVGSFRAPVYATSPPGDSTRLFVVEQAGRIRVIRRGRVLRRPFLDIGSRVLAGGERGLLSMAFAPDYARSRLFYVYFTDRSGDIRIEEFRAAGPDIASAASGRLVLSQDHSQFPNHNGGALAFGPDGLLYIGLGDGGSENDPSNHGQDLGSLLGKILRIDPRPSGGRPYSIPASNPFRGRPGARPEIYAYGLRNPWRFSFDRRTGDLVIADVGQNLYEEIDFARRGRARGVNYGWRRFEGRHRFSDTPAPGAVPPVLEQTHADGWCAIVGGYVVRDRSLGSLYGRYLYGDNCKTGIRSVRLSSGRARGDRSMGLGVPALSSFGEDARGRVYVTSLAGGVYRLAPR